MKRTLSATSLSNNSDNNRKPAARVMNNPVVRQRADTSQDLSPIQRICLEQENDLITDTIPSQAESIQQAYKAFSHNFTHYLNNRDAIKLKNLPPQDKGEALAELRTQQLNNKQSMLKVLNQKDLFNEIQIFLSFKDGENLRLVMPEIARSIIPFEQHLENVMNQEKNIYSRRYTQIRQKFVSQERLYQYPNTIKRILYCNSSYRNKPNSTITDKDIINKFLEHPHLEHMPEVIEKLLKNPISIYKIKALLSNPNLANMPTIRQKLTNFNLEKIFKKFVPDKGRIGSDILESPNLYLVPHLADFLLRGNYETTSGYPWQSQISFVNNPNLHLMPENLIQNILDKHDPYLIQLLKRNKNIHLMPESIKQSMYEKGYFNQTLN